MQAVRFAKRGRESWSPVKSGHRRLSRPPTLPSLLPVTGVAERASVGLQPKLQTNTNKNRLNMKKLLVAICLTCALAMAVQAAEGKKERKLTEEQKTLQKDMLAKYDANKDGKLDRDERAKISTEDKEKMDKAGLTRKKKDKSK